mmetsp:Transcript_108792/g.307615  ORF Transcript_108792/g.307615 Transcript_108792/m.307615 type:complete len:354 (-) Transcript_108792:84-1145(-)
MQALDLARGRDGGCGHGHGDGHDALGEPELQQLAARGALGDQEPQLHAEGLSVEQRARRHAVGHADLRELGPALEPGRGHQQPRQAPGPPQGELLALQAPRPEGCGCGATAVKLVGNKLELRQVPHRGHVAALRPQLAGRRHALGIGFGHALHGPGQLEGLLVHAAEQQVRLLFQAQRPRGQLKVHKDQEPDWPGQQLPEYLQQPTRQPQLARAVHGPYEDARAASPDVAQGEQPLAPPLHVRAHLWRGGVVVPEAATPASALVDFQSVLLVRAHRREGQKVLEVCLEAVDDAFERRAHPVERVGLFLQPYGLKATRHAAEAAEAHKLPAVDESSHSRIIEAKPGTPCGDLGF